MPIDLTKKNTIPIFQIPRGLLINLSATGIFIVAAISVCVFLINPRCREIKNMNQRISSLSKLNQEEINQFNQKEEKLIYEKNLVTNKVESAKGILRGNRNISNILDQFITTAKKRSLEFTYLKPLAKKDASFKNEDINLTFQEVPISVKLESGFLEFLNFLWDAEHGLQTFKISDLSIEKNSQNPARHRESITISVYQLVEDKDNTNAKPKK